MENTIEWVILQQCPKSGHSQPLGVHNAVVASGSLESDIRCSWTLQVSVGRNWPTENPSWESFDLVAGVLHGRGPFPGNGLASSSFPIATVLPVAPLPSERCWPISRFRMTEADVIVGGGDPLEEGRFFPQLNRRLF